MQRPTTARSILFAIYAILALAVSTPAVYAGPIHRLKHHTRRAAHHTKGIARVTRACTPAVCGGACGISACNCGCR